MRVKPVKQLLNFSLKELPMRQVKLKISFVIFLLKIFKLNVKVGIFDLTSDWPLYF